VQRRIDPRAPLLARIYTGFVNPAAHELSPLTARTAAGEVVTPFPASVVLLPFSPADPADYGVDSVAVQFGDGLSLIGVQMPSRVQAGQAMTMTLLWEASAPLDVDLTAFAHLLGPDGTQVAGFDQAPGGDRYPTRHWLPGDRAVQTMTLSVPEGTSPGVYAAWVGVYTAGSSGADRLPVTSAGGLESAHSLARLGTVEIGD
jgi:hypothetical protein